MNGEWQILSISSWPRKKGYELLAPDGQYVGHFSSMEDAKAEAKRLQIESLKHTEPFKPDPR